MGRVGKVVDKNAGVAVGKAAEGRVVDMAAGRVADSVDVVEDKAAGMVADTVDKAVEMSGGMPAGKDTDMAVEMVVGRAENCMLEEAEVASKLAHRAPGYVQEVG